MTQVRDVWGEAKTDLAGPCDPSDRFERSETGELMLVIPLVYRPPSEGVHCNVTPAPFVPLIPAVDSLRSLWNESSS